MVYGEARRLPRFTSSTRTACGRTHCQHTPGDISMKNRIRSSAALLLIAALAACFGIYSRDRVEAATRPQQPEKSSTPYQQPAVNGAQPDSAEPESVYGPSFAFLAWNLFVRAMAPANGSLP